MPKLFLCTYIICLTLNSHLPIYNSEECLDVLSLYIRIDVEVCIIMYEGAKYLIC